MRPSQEDIQEDKALTRFVWYFAITVLVLCIGTGIYVAWNLGYIS